MYALVVSYFTDNYLNIKYIFHFARIFLIEDNLNILNFEGIRLKFVTNEREVVIF